MGLAIHRGTRVPFGILGSDRSSHTVAVGRTGTGKTTFLNYLARQDLAGRRGVAVLDPHGQWSEHLSSLSSSSIYIDAGCPSEIYRIDPFGLAQQAGCAIRSRVVDQSIEIFRSLWSDAWGPRLEHLLRNVVFLLLENSGTTLADVNPLLTNQTYREKLLSQLTNHEVRHFWENEYTGYSPAFRAVVVAPLQNKLGALLTDPLMKRILTGPGKPLDFRKIIDEGTPLIVNLAKGQIGEGNASLLGSLIVSGIAQAGLSRVDTPEHQRRDYHLYLDEFHHFTTRSIAMMLSELRKYRINLILAHQHLSQLTPEIKDAVFGNVGTFLSFRVGAQDAGLIARELGPPITAEDLVHLPNYHFYIKLLINGEPSAAFSAKTIDYESRDL